MSARMEQALELADKCWGKAYAKEPEFVERYLELAEGLLVRKLQVTGDEFREHCRNNLLFRPQSLHHNVWVSGVRAMELMGWISKVKKVEPVKMHNHMPVVTLWYSNLYEPSNGSDT